MWHKYQPFMHPKRHGGRLHARQPAWKSPHDYKTKSLPFDKDKHLKTTKTL